ncbi:hypothetical protein [Stutzerimonas degradans]|uniref:hypothetical protein n=1 Tax=Stutzerimonas degradans TaxID=2968968 RepID=UPI001C49A513|nr:hypothetical protein [Stutzerimonas degradans]
MPYRLNRNAPTSYISGAGFVTTISAEKFYEAIALTHATIDEIANFRVDIFAVLGMRNLSAFIGELYAASLIEVTGHSYRKNPHQDGYPDLLLMDGPGIQCWNELEKAGRLRDKAPFSPFPNGGIEVKATCGAVPNAEKCRRKGLEGKPAIGEQRIGVMDNYDWKAHHQETNNLASILWDFIDGLPRIAAVFFCPSLEVNDWGEIVKPRDGGGRTTSVSIMTKGGVRKMYESWVAIYEDDPRYADFLNRKNRGNLI